MNFGVDGTMNLFTLFKKDRSGQQQNETSESIILYCLKKMHQEINGHCQGIMQEFSLGVGSHVSITL